MLEYKPNIVLSEKEYNIVGKRPHLFPALRAPAPARVSNVAERPNA